MVWRLDKDDFACDVCGELGAQEAYPFYLCQNEDCPNRAFGFLRGWQSATGREMTPNDLPQACEAHGVRGELYMCSACDLEALQSDQ